MVKQAEQELGFHIICLKRIKLTDAQGIPIGAHLNRILETLKYSRFLTSVLLFHESKEAITKIFIVLLFFEIQFILENITFFKLSCIFVIFQFIEMAKEHSYKVFCVECSGVDSFIFE